MTTICFTCFSIKFIKISFPKVQLLLLLCVVLLILCACLFLLSYSYILRRLMLIMISFSKLNCYNLLFCCSNICLMISPPPQGVYEVWLEPFEKVGKFQQTMGFCECVPILKGLPKNPIKKKFAIVLTHTWLQCLRFFQCTQCHTLCTFAITFILMS